MNRRSPIRLSTWGTELQLPVPPLRPGSLVQPRSLSLITCPSGWILRSSRNAAYQPRRALRAVGCMRLFGGLPATVSALLRRQPPRLRKNRPVAMSCLALQFAAVGAEDEHRQPAFRGDEVESLPDAVGVLVDAHEVPQPLHDPSPYQTHNPRPLFGAAEPECSLVKLHRQCRALDTPEAPD